MTRNLGELVYRPCTGHVAGVRVEGTAAVLSLRPDTSLPARELATLLRADGLVSADAADVHTVTARFNDAAAAAELTLETCRLATGDFEVASFQEDKLLALRRIRPGRQFGRLEFHNVATEEEEWRRFLADQVDLVPSISSQQAAYLREDPTVQIVEFSRPGTAALYFRTDAPALADAKVRLALSLALDRRAIATVVNGAPDTALTAKEDLAEARRMLSDLGYGPDHPLALKFWVTSEGSDFQRAALVIQQ